MLLGQGHAGHAREEVIDDADAEQAGDAPVGAVIAHQEEADPDQPFAEVVGVAAPGPQSAFADLALVGGVLLEGRQLGVGDALD